MADTARCVGRKDERRVLRARRRHILGAIVVMTLVAVSIASLPIAPAVRAQMPATTAQPTWRDTGLPNKGSANPCFDMTTPGLFYTSERQGDAASAPQATYANSALTGQRTPIAMQGFDACNTRTGSLFAHVPNSATALRFSAREPTGRMIDHFPDYIAPDGSVLYSAGNSFPAQYTHAPDAIEPESANRLFYVSVDDGLTWQERGRQFAGNLAAVAPVDGTPQSLYALVRPDPADGGMAMGGIPYSLQFSADAGATWEQRYAGMLIYKALVHGSDRVYLNRIPGIAIPAGTISLEFLTASLSPHSGANIQLSADGGRTFASVSGVDDIAYRSLRSFYATSAGIIRIGTSTDDVADLSTDGGATFAPLALPVMPDPASQGRDLGFVVAPTAPNYVLCYRVSYSSLRPPSDIYLSTDGGKTWGRLATQPDALIVFMPMMPPSLLAFTKTGVLALDLMGESAAASATPTAATMPVTMPTAATNPSATTLLNVPATLAAFQARGSVAAAGLGTAISDPYTENGIASVSFENGAMLYLPGRNSFYVLVSGQGNPLIVVPRTFGDAGLTTALAPGPRPGTFVPRLGFGKIWQDNPALQQQLGYATGDERRFTDAVQSYQNGLVVADTANSSVYLLNTAQGAWDRASP